MNRVLRLHIIGQGKYSAQLVFSVLVFDQISLVSSPAAMAIIRGFMTDWGSLACRVTRLRHYWLTRLRHYFLTADTI